MINDQGAQLIAEALKDDLWVKGQFWKIVKSDLVLNFMRLFVLGFIISSENGT